MTGTNLAAISQAWPQPHGQHAASQMEVEGVRYMKKRMRQSGFAHPSNLYVLS